MLLDRVGSERTEIAVSVASLFPFCRCRPTSPRFGQSSRRTRCWTSRRKTAATRTKLMEGNLGLVKSRTRCA
jgi:hypothetical protein